MDRESEIVAIAAGVSGVLKQVIDLLSEYSRAHDPVTREMVLAQFKVLSDTTAAIDAAIDRRLAARLAERKD